MPKLKTHSGTKKRFKLTKTGKIKYFSCNKNHILTKKSSRRKRNLRKASYVDHSNKAAFKQLLPYA